MKISVVITAAGSGSRFCHTENKLFYTVRGKTILQYTLDKFIAHSQIDEIIVTLAPCDMIHASKLTFGNKSHRIVEGGNTRTLSVYQGLLACSTPDIVLIHDGARPFVTERIIDSCLACTCQFGSGICSVPTFDTLARADINGNLTERIDRENVYAIQTPQGFRYSDIKFAYTQNKGKMATDDSCIYSQYFGYAKLCEGHSSNVKITTTQDLQNFD